MSTKTYGGDSVAGEKLLRIREGPICSFLRRHNVHLWRYNIINTSLPYGFCNMYNHFLLKIMCSRFLSRKRTIYNPLGLACRIALSNSWCLPSPGLRCNHRRHCSTARSSRPSTPSAKYTTPSMKEPPSRISHLLLPELCPHEWRWTNCSCS